LRKAQAVTGDEVAADILRDLNARGVAALQLNAANLLNVLLGDQATLAGRDPSTDVAVLRTKTEGLTPLEFTDGEGLQVGNLVLVAGRPGRSVRSSMSRRSSRPSLRGA